MRRFTVGPYLSRSLRAKLFGNRERYGLEARADDEDWLEWQRVYLDAYEQTQRRSIGKIVNDAGYKVMRTIDLENKSVLELGPGDMGHTQAWNGVPGSYVTADVNQGMLDQSRHALADLKVPFSDCLLQRGVYTLPFEDSSFDVVVAFYCLEHLFPLGEHLRELRRVLRPAGILVGAIPCEGGLGWGIGRLLTTRRWLRSKQGVNINLEKVVCWEHPNLAAEVLDGLDETFQLVHLTFWPWLVRSIDLNLVVRFAYRKRESV